MSRLLTKVEQESLQKRFEIAARQLRQEKYSDCCGFMGFSIEFLEEIIVTSMVRGLYVFQKFRDELPQA